MHAPRARRVRVALLAAACAAGAACGPQPGSTEAPRNTAGSSSPRLSIAPDQPLGWIGIAPRAARGTDWIPASNHAVLLPTPAEGAPSGALTAIDTAGKVARVTAAGPVQVLYGCDNTSIDALAFAGAPLAPGAVWLLPPGAPPTWNPRALPIAVAVSGAEARRRDTVGPLALELERTGPTRGTLAIQRGGRSLHTLPFERADMEGADPAPLDLRGGGVAIPAPVAAWALAEGEVAPILLVLLSLSYEGSYLQAILVEDAGARVLPALETYLYRCAF